MPSRSQTSTETSGPKSPDRERLKKLAERAHLIASEIRRRIRLRAKAEDSPDNQAVVLKHCANDFVAWCNDWVWTYDPRNKSPVPKHLPFRLWDCQETLAAFILQRYERDESGIVKKSRDMGFSWIAAAIAVWLWLFVPGCSITFGSRKEELVDKLGDPDAIFPKIRIIIRSLPKWMLPAGFTHSDHDHFMRIRNPQTGAIITGEVGDNMGRGGRSSIYFADEFAFVPRAKQARAAIGGNADVVIYGSTSNGVGTEFYEMEQSGAFPVHLLHWKDHPFKDRAWKEKKVLEIGEVNFAREYDMDDGTALENLLVPARWVMACVNLPLPEDGIRAAGLDVAAQGDDENVYTFRAGPVLKRLEAWTGHNTTQTARKAFRYAVEDRAEILRFDEVGIGAGVHGTAHDEAPDSLIVVGVDGGAKCTKTYYSDDPRKKARDRFRYLVTEVWWAFRVRCKKTWEHVEGTKKHPLDELVSLIDDPRLISQLSTRKFEEMEAGKIKAESKKKMRGRGVKSPDRADSVVYCYADCVKPSSMTFTKEPPKHVIR